MMVWIQEVMLGKSVGGRGKKADSATVQVRVPVAIKDLVEQLITTFHKVAAGNEETTEAPFTPTVMDAQAVILSAIDKFIELRRSEWGQNGAQVGKFNPQVTRYDMLQKFRRAVEQKDLIVQPAPSQEGFAEAVFRVWQQIATETLAPENCWGHPVKLSAIYARLPLMSWQDFLSQLARIPGSHLELVPSRFQNWTVGQRSVGALTFHHPPKTST
jgi:hypothetical protein